MLKYGMLKDIILKYVILNYRMNFDIKCSWNSKIHVAEQKIMLRLKCVMLNIKYAKIYNAKIYNAEIYNSKIYNAKIYNAKIFNAKIYNAKIYNAKI